MLSYYEYDNKQKEIILFLKFAFNTDLGPKKMFAWPTNDNFLLQNQPKVQIILALLFSEKRWKLCTQWQIMPKNYVSTIYQSLLQALWSHGRKKERGAYYLQAPV